MARRKKQSGGDIPEWVVTYGDLMSLLLCFFILLAAFSELKRPHEYQQVLQAIKEALGSSSNVSVVDIDQIMTNAPENPEDTFEPLSAPTPELASSPDQDIQDIHSKATRLNDAQVITVGTQLLFDEGSWELSQQMRRVLTQQVLPQIKGKRNKVMVRGHAYGEGDRSGRRSLMDMSFRRANAVSDFLVSQGANPLAIVLHAAGDTEPRVIPTSFAESVDRNRRVELLLSEITIDQMHPDPDGTGRTR